MKVHDVRTDRRCVAFATAQICLPILTLILALAMVRPASAFFDPPWITPTTPTSDDTVWLHVHGGICDAIFGEEGYPQITRDGNTITIVWYGQHWPEGSGDLLCSFGIGTLDYSLGAFPPGEYSVVVELAYINFSGFPEILTIGQAPLTVTGAAGQEAVPASNGFFSSLLVLLICAAEGIKAKSALAARS